jgi:redox-sensitive bicupin YhaK (pirin superfamily)
MGNRPVKKIYPAYRDDIGDLRTVRPIPAPGGQVIDPFLFLNHHGPQFYAPDNAGLPFGPHPHRGFQTVTFVLEGDISHKDSAGHECVIDAGGVQWMNAGRGLVHEELSSAQFEQRGGPMEILQLWINLPSRLKMSEPSFLGLQKNQIPVLEKDLVQIQVIAGELEGAQGPFKPSTDISIFTIFLKAHGKAEFKVPSQRNILFYVVRGAIRVNDLEVANTILVEFESRGDTLSIEALSDSFILLGHAEPYGEPVVFGGPFVMNTEAEIHQAIADYRSGKLK